MDEREEIKNRIDIVDLIQGYFPLKKSGRNYKACCPFHSEKTPSFMVSAERQNWHCFGSCSEGGDIFSFLMKMEGLDFYSALKMLADRVGVKLKKENKNFSENKDKKDKYFEINEIAAKYYEKVLFEPEGKIALNYLKKRDISEKTIKEFRLGYAPKKSTLLTDLQKIGFTDAEQLASGVAKNRDGKLLEYFWQRIIFPIADSAGSIVGFTARTLSDEIQPKYLNTSDTEIYHKSKVLYGMDKAKTAIRKLDHAIIVEGNMDVIASHQAGIKNVIAASGTAFTETQLGIVKRFTKNIKLSFDVDFAGSEATKRAIEMAMDEGFNVKVIEIPDGPSTKLGVNKDPADVIKEDKNLWILSCKNAKYVIDYVFDKAFEKNNPKEILGKKAIARELLEVIKKIPDEIEREHYIKELSKKLDVEADALRNALNKVKNTKEVKKEKDTKKLNKETLEERLLGLLLRFPEYRNFFFRNIKKEAFTDLVYIEIYELIKEGNDKKIKKHEKAGLLEFKIEEEFADFDHEKIGEEIFFLTKRLKKVFIKNKGFEVRKKLKEAEKNKDTVSVAKWLKSLNEILKEEGEI